MAEPSRRRFFIISEIDGASERPSNSAISIELNQSDSSTTFIMPAKSPGVLIKLAVIAVTLVTLFGLYTGIREFATHLAQFTIFGKVYVMLGFLVTPLLTIALWSLLLRPFTMTESVSISHEAIITSRRSLLGISKTVRAISSITSFEFQRDFQGLKQPQAMIYFNDPNANSIEIFEAARPDEKEWIVSALNVVLAKAKASKLD